MKRLLIAGVIALALFAGIVVLGVMLPTSPDRLPYSATNPRPNGTRALAQVLGANGVTVTQVTTLAAATAAPAGSTLVVVLTDDLSDSATAALMHVPADLVVVYPGVAESFTVADLAAHRVMTADRWASSDAAGCSDPDAQAAGSITDDSNWALESPSSRVTTCFVNDDRTALYADLTTDTHRVTILTGRTWLQNGTITEQGNAALALRAFGRHPQLTWYLPGEDVKDAGDTDEQGFDLFDLLPPWSRPVFAVLLVAGAAAALWRGRRFGALVKEPMPVEVPASEASSGLAGLYRQAGARGHAAAALRAAAIMRVSARLGLSASASPQTVVERIAQASGADPGALNALLYGTPPATDQELADLAHTLTDLERKLSSR